MKQDHNSRDEEQAALPPLPETEPEQLGFIENPEDFPEQTIDCPVAPGPYQPNWESIASHAAPDWWNDAKFGVFIHWGPQAAGRSGDWYARKLYDENEPAYASHLKNFGHPSEIGYKDVLHQWRPDQWDPAAAVDAFRDAGFRYALVVGVHHDNYDLWNSRHHPWNSVKVGPRQDFLAGWQRELERAGMRFGVAFHHEYTWWWWQTAFGADSSGPRAGVPYDGNLTMADGKGKWWEGLDPRRFYGIPLRYPEAKCDGQPFAIRDIPFGRRGIFGNHLAYARWYATQWALRMQDVVDNYAPDFIYTDGNDLFPFSGAKSGSGYKCDVAARVVADFYNKAADGKQAADKLGDKQADFQFEPGDYRFTAGADGSVYVWTLCPPAPGEEFVVRSLGRDAGLLETPPRQVTRLGSNQSLTWHMQADGLHVCAPGTADASEIQGYRIFL